MLPTGLLLITMSKTKLKKELATLDRDQLQSIIFDMYDALKDARTYLEFFIKPDIEALYEKYCKQIDKELSRTKRRECTARITKIRAAIKEFAAFDVGAEWQIKIMLYSLEQFVTQTSFKIMPVVITHGFTKMAITIMDMADKNGLFSTTLKSMETLLDGHIGYIGIVNYIRRNLSWPIIEPRQNKRSY